MFSVKWAAGVVASAILTMVIIYGLKKTNIPVVSTIAKEV